MNNKRNKMSEKVNDAITNFREKHPNLPLYLAIASLLASFIMPKINQLLGIAS